VNLLQENLPHHQRHQIIDLYQKNLLLQLNYHYQFHLHLQ
jgi:hypothetical protein